MSDRNRLSRRTVLRTTAGLAGAAIGASVTAGARSETGGLRGRSARFRSAVGAASAEVDQYVATVDRVVDGEHVVILLEEDCTVVDQLVVSKDEHEDLEERDILIVVVEDGELLAYQHIPQKPPCDGRR